MSGIAGRGGRRIDSPRERELAARIDRAIDHIATAGKSLTISASPYPVEVAGYLRAAAGPPAWSRRLARIQQLISELRESLAIALAEHRIRFSGRSQQLQQSWQRHVAAIDLASINELIDKHNLYYPTEAQLRMQWPNGRYILPQGMQFPMPRLTSAALLQEFPWDG
jgi:hypothetical protein